MSNKLNNGQYGNPKKPETNGNISQLNGVGVYVKNTKNKSKKDLVKQNFINKKLRVIKIFN